MYSRDWSSDVCSSDLALPVSTTRRMWRCWPQPIRCTAPLPQLPSAVLVRRGIGRCQRQSEKALSATAGDDAIRETRIVAKAVLVLEIRHYSEQLAHAGSQDERQRGGRTPRRSTAKALSIHRSSIQKHRLTTKATNLCNTTSYTLRSGSYLNWN